MEKPQLPEGCELPNRTNIQVKKIENKEAYIDLLLEADPSKDMISKYLNASDVYGLKIDEEIVSIAVILPISKNTLELKNLVTKEEYRGKGYGSTMLKDFIKKYETIILSIESRI